MLFPAVTGWTTLTMMMITMMMTMTVKHHFQPYHFQFSIQFSYHFQPYQLLWHDGYSLGVDTSLALIPTMATLVIFCCFTLQLFVPLTFPNFNDIKSGIFTSGNATCHYKYFWNRKKQTTPSYIALLLPVSFHCLLVH